MPEDTKLLLHALFAQAKNGPVSRDTGDHPHTAINGDESSGSGTKLLCLSPSSSSSGIGPADLVTDARVEGLKRSYSSPPALIPSESSSSSCSSAASPDSHPTGTVGRSMSTDQGQLEAGRDWSSLCQEDAMRSFLGLLFSLAPYWKYEQFI